ncbi:hypothetical protein [Halorubrum amylolyticum]|uniref:hypothetical protein n=1 Tax=Halorubrum amylolyticum TaxID=2508724 RepID=UPI001008E0C3|nr:hypothetical protein [Halorubrum amylolyticum]
MTTVQRHYHYRAVAAIDPESYTPTDTGDGVGYAFRFTDPVREQLETLAADAIERETGATAVRVDAERGYVDAVVRPALEGTTGSDILSALQGVASTWNRRHATADGDGGYLDPLRFGDRYLEAVRPEDGLTPEGFVDRYCDPPENLPADEPVLDLDGNADRDRNPNRHLPVTCIVPIDPESYTVDRGSRNEPVTFEWGSEHTEQLRHKLQHGTNWSGDAYRVRVHPHYIRVDVDTGAIARPPIDALHPRIRNALQAFNVRRAPLGVDDTRREIRRPKLQVGDTVYIGSRTVDGRGDDAAAVALDAVDDTPPEDGPESDDSDDDDDDGGILGRFR